MKRLRVPLIGCALICGVVAVVYFAVRALTGERVSVTVRRINAVRMVPGRPRTIEVEARAGVCNSKEVRHLGELLSLKLAHDRKVYMTVSSSEPESQYCLGEEVAIIRRLKLPGRVSRFAFLDTGTSPPTRLQLLGPLSRSH